MRLPHKSWHTRCGVTLVMFVVLLPVLIGFVGLVIDTGLLIATMRQTQNAADAAALAAARDMLTLSRNPDAGVDPRLSAQNYAEQNGMASPANVQVNIPPLSGPYAGDTNYVEVIITKPLRTVFIQAVGINPEQQVTARAVAGFEFARFSDVLILLHPNPSPSQQGGPGLRVDGTGLLLVDGGIAVNSEAPVAATSQMQEGRGVYARNMEVVGGVVNPDEFKTFLSYTEPLGNVPLGDLLLTGEVPAPDPFLNSLHPPTTTANEVPLQYPDKNIQNTGEKKDVIIQSSESAVLYPGIYKSITILGGTVKLMPGIYVLAGGGLKIQAGATVSIPGSPTDPNVPGRPTDPGVMFYNTGSNYEVERTGLPDLQDAGFPVNDPAITNKASISINSQQGGSIDLRPFKAPNSPFDKMLIYQRPWNQNEISINGAGSAQLTGGIYAKWAPVMLEGGSSVSGAVTIQTQIVVGSLKVTGNAVLKPMLEATKVYEVFLVE